MQAQAYKPKPKLPPVVLPRYQSQYDNSDDEEEDDSSSDEDGRSDMIVVKKSAPLKNRPSTSGSTKQPIEDDEDDGMDDDANYSLYSDDSRDSSYVPEDDDSAMAEDIPPPRKSRAKKSRPATPQTPKSAAKRSGSSLSIRQPTTNSSARIPQEDWVPPRPSAPYNNPTAPAVYNPRADLPARLLIVLRVIRLAVRRSFQYGERHGMPNRSAVYRLLQDTGYNTFVDSEGKRSGFFGPRGDILRTAIIRKYHINDLGMSRNLWEDLTYKDSNRPTNRSAYIDHGPNGNGRNAARRAVEVPCASSQWISDSMALNASRDDDTDDEMEEDSDHPNSENSENTEDADLGNAPVPDDGENDTHRGDSTPGFLLTHNSPTANGDEDSSETESLNTNPSSNGDEDHEMGDGDHNIDNGSHFQSVPPQHNQAIPPSFYQQLPSQAANYNTFELPNQALAHPPGTMDPSVLQFQNGNGQVTCTTHGELFGLLAPPPVSDVQMCLGSHHGDDPVSVCIQCYEAYRNRIPYPRNILYWNGAWMPICKDCSDTALETAMGVGCLCPTTTRTRLCHVCLFNEMNMIEASLKQALDARGINQYITNGPIHLANCADCAGDPGQYDNSRRCTACTQLVLPPYNAPDVFTAGLQTTFHSRCGPPGYVSELNAVPGCEVEDLSILYEADHPFPIQ